MARRRGHALRAVPAALLAGLLLFPATAPAQMLSTLNSPVVTLDQDRLYAETLFGRRLARELETASRELAARNRALTEELTAEEKALTEKRKELEPDAFRELADAFDEKVTRLREEQDARILGLQRRRDLERRAFSGRVLPILSDIVIETGALAILDDRAVILAADSIDITDRAIARIDELLGDGLPKAPSDPPTAVPGEGGVEEAPAAQD